MHVAMNSMPARIDAPGAIARQVADFGSAEGYGQMAGEWFSLGAGTDIQPLLLGLEGDACQAPHWGVILAGEVVVSYTDGSTETCAKNDLFYWPPGHSVRVTADAEVVLFSPAHEHNVALDHMKRRMGGD